MRTFTPKFGRFAQLNANRIRQIGQQRMKQVREMRALFLRNERNNFLQGQKRTSKDIQKKIERLGKHMASNSPHEVLVGELTDWNNATRTLVASISSAEVSTELNSDEYKHKAFMSLDGLLRPVTIGENDSKLPKNFKVKEFSELSDEGLEGIVKKAGRLHPRGAIGPLQDGDEGESSYHGINAKTEVVSEDLNPYTNPASASALKKVIVDKNASDGYGHDIELVGREGPGANDEPEQMYMKDLSHTGGEEADYQSSYNTLALRGPLYLQQWGYDLDGKPVPNSKDDEEDAKNGTFTADELENKFLQNWLQKPQTWPVAPVDLRLDRDRGVWVAPQKPDNLYVRFDDKITGVSGTGMATVIRHDENIKYYDKFGFEIVEPKVKVYSFTDLGIKKGASGVIAWNQSRGVWDIVGGGGGGSVNVIYGRTMEVIPMCTGTLEMDGETLSSSGIAPTSGLVRPLIFDEEIKAGKPRPSWVDELDGEDPPEPIEEYWTNQNYLDGINKNVIVVGLREGETVSIINVGINPLRKVD
jgi:hypothetical protein